MTAAKAARKTANDSKSKEEKTVSDRVQDNFETLKDAVPSVEDAKSYVQDNAPDIQHLSDTTSEFVRRNPGTSLAAAAGIGIVQGLLISKR